MIHTVLILKKDSGLKVWGKSYSKEIAWDEYLTSGLITAILNLSSVVFGAEVYDIELGPYRMIFESGAKEFTIIAVFDKSDSIIYMIKRLGRLKEEIESRYGEVLARDFIKGDDFPQIDGLCDFILSGSSKWKLRSSQKRKLIEELNKLRSNHEILECDIISTTGIPLGQVWQEDLLNICLRQIDAFWKSTQYMVDQIIISYQENYIILHKIGNHFVLTASIRRDTPLGLATFLIDDFIKIASKLIE